MAKQSIVPFGPQHPVLPEPIHLDLVLEDEVVVKAVPSIGFVHRGLEKLVETKDYKEYVYIAERVCGICSFGHGMGYCQCIEKIMNVEVPRRAEYLRTIWMEMSRVHSHLLWLGLLADAMGFESLFMQCWRLREKILDMFDATTGGQRYLLGQLRRRRAQGYGFRHAPSDCRYRRRDGERAAPHCRIVSARSVGGNPPAWAGCAESRSGPSDGRCRPDAPRQRCGV